MYLRATLRSTLGSTAVMFAALAVCWGSSFVAIDVGLEFFPALYFAGIRYAAAGAVVLGVAAVTTDRLRPRARAEWAAVGVAAVLLIAVYHGLLYVGIGRVDGAVAAVVTSLMPVLTAVFASTLLPEERLGPVELAGLLLGFGGVIVIAAPAPGALGTANTVGIAAVFLGAAAFALGAVLTRPLDSRLPVQTTMAWAMLLGGGLLLAGGAARGESVAAIRWTGPAVASLAYLTLVSGVFAFLVYFALLERVGPTEINLVGYAEPIVASLAGWALLGHAVEASTVSGFAAILVGFVLVKRDVLYDVAATARVRG